MKKAIIYARVSTVRQADDGVSMESQIEQCRVKAAALGADAGVDAGSTELGAGHGILRGKRCETRNPAPLPALVRALPLGTRGAIPVKG